MRRQKHIHFMGICGYTMSGLAVTAKSLGYKVSGSDEGAYPPATDIVTKAGISWVNHHKPSNLVRWGTPDIVVQGNQIRKGNPEAEEARGRELTLPLRMPSRLAGRMKQGERNLREENVASSTFGKTPCFRLRRMSRAFSPRKFTIVSEAEFFYRLTKDRRRIVVCGTHGKTTTTTLITWILKVAGRNPGYRLGARPRNFDQTVALGEGKEFVFEGDEYTTAIFDPRPKFYHFHPQVAVLLNIEWDHPDVYKTEAAYTKVFAKMVRNLPVDGRLIANAEDPMVRKLIGESSCLTETFGLKSGDWQVKNIKHLSYGTGFTIFHHGKKFGDFKIKLAGVHNVQNALAAIAASSGEGVRGTDIKKALETFEGTSRRFEVKGVVSGITVIDDYAHHPTKARATIQAAKSRYPKAKVFVVYVPHTFSRTKSLLDRYAAAFNEADEVIIPDIEPAREKHLERTVHAKDVVAAVGQHNPRACYIPEQKEVIARLRSRVKKGDVILCMSVRGFDNLAEKVVKSLQGRTNC